MNWPSSGTLTTARISTIVVGLTAAIDAASRGRPVGPGLPPPINFLAVPFFDMVVFAALVGAALIYRRRSVTHKRLMLRETIEVMAFWRR